MCVCFSKTAIKNKFELIDWLIWTASPSYSLCFFLEKNPIRHQRAHLCRKMWINKLIQLIRVRRGVANECYIAVTLSIASNGVAIWSTTHWQHCWQILAKHSNYYKMREQRARARFAPLLWFLSLNEIIYLCSEKYCKTERNRWTSRNSIGR